MSAEHNIEMAKRLVKCADVTTRLRAELTTIEAWSDDAQLLGEASLRERLKLIRQHAGEAKDIALEI